MAHLDSKKPPYLWNPYEIAFTGYSNSGKTTLIEKLFPLMKGSGIYIKHDAHSFEMDKSGKDTFRAREAGAKAVFISNQDKTAFLSDEPPSLFSNLPFLDFDFAFIEGYKESKTKKILILDEEAKILDLEIWKKDRPLAVVSRFAKINLPWNIPYFHANEIQEIIIFIESYFTSLVPAVKSLVLMGGRSSRMGLDKAFLPYKGKAQILRISEMLKENGLEVLISCREDQSGLLEGQACIFDTFLGLGPLSGILSAMHADRKSAWLVLGVDMPFINNEAINRLLKSRNPFRYASSFRGHEDFPEPLATIYEPKVFTRLLETLGLGFDCPRKVLINSPIEIIEPDSKKWIENINHYDEYTEANRDLSS